MTEEEIDLLEVTIQMTRIVVDMEDALNYRGYVPNLGHLAKVKLQQGRAEVDAMIIKWVKEFTELHKETDFNEVDRTNLIEEFVENKAKD